MKSIAHYVPFKQGVEVYPLGIHIEGKKPKIAQKGDGDGATGKKRGKIETFSAAARRRMRKAMLSLHIPGGSLVGASLTVPWKGTNFEPLMDEFRDSVDRFGKSFRRKYPNSAAIYRVELQERGAPHLHALLWLDRRDAAGALGGHACAPLRGPAASACLELEVGAMWRGSVHDLHHGSIRAFDKFGCKVEPIADAGAMFRYLADHASKHKQAQLGYKGKQWGIIGRANLVERKPVKLPPFKSFKHRACFNRLLRKVMRYRLQASRHPNWKRVPPFGSVLAGSARNVGDFYLRSSTARRMWVHSLIVSRGDFFEPRKIPEFVGPPDPFATIRSYGWLPSGRIAPEPREGA